MIGRVGAISLAATPIAATAVQGATVATAQPVIWHLLGYPFEAASMCAALFACATSRWWLGAAQSTRKQYRWQLDAPVTVMMLALAAGLVIGNRPTPLVGLLFGAGSGVLGEGFFKLAENYVRRLFSDPGGTPQ